MPEIQKYNLIQRLKKADEEYAGSTAIAGKSALTMYNNNNSARTIMFNSHINQFVNLFEPDFPYIFTNMENTVGKHSNCYYEAKNNYVVYKKVVKFEDICENPEYYYLFIYDEENDKYDVINRKPVENLTETFGFPYMNDKIDELNENDPIYRGDTLYHSTSMDDYGNYRYGRNANVLYLLDPDSSEDAAIISESFAEKMSSLEVETITYGVNENDIPLNIFGDSNEYKSIPEIGDKIDGIAAVLRPQFNDQLLFDFKNKNLSSIKDGDKVIYYESVGTVIDYEIYCNNQDLEYTDYNEQYIKYLDSQTKFWQKINTITKEIKNSGSKYSNNVDYLFKRSRDFIDTNRKWREGDNAFSNIMIKVTIAKRVPMSVGNKFTGRYGNKSVVSVVRPDDKMHHTKDGKRCDVILNLLAIINRTTGFVPMELYANFILTKTRERMATFKTRAQKESLLFEMIRNFNKDEAKEMKKIYDSLDKSDKEIFIDDCINNGIYIHQSPIKEDRPFFYKLEDIRNKYDWLKPYKMYINKWENGDTREIPILQRMYMGQMYLFRLKQSDTRGFSARSTGAINTKGLPERSYKNRNHLERESDTAIRFGEFESLNFMIGMMPEELALFHALYRTCVKGREDLLFSQLTKDGKIKLPKKYKSTVAEIFSVIFKSLGLELRYENEDDILRETDSRFFEEHELDGKYYLCSNKDFFMIEYMHKVKEKILELYPLIETEELNKQIEIEMNAANKIMSPNEFSLLK